MGLWMGVGILVALYVGFNDFELERGGLRAGFGILEYPKRLH